MVTYKILAVYLAYSQASGKQFVLSPSLLGTTACIHVRNGATNVTWREVSKLPVDMPGDFFRIFSA